MTDESVAKFLPEPLVPDDETVSPGRLSPATRRSLEELETDDAEGSHAPGLRPLKLEKS